jgi:hypothetical protein
MDANQSFRRELIFSPTLSRKLINQRMRFQERMGHPRVIEARPRESYDWPGIPRSKPPLNR